MIDTEENKAFLKENAKRLLEFGQKFPSPGGSSYYLGDDGTPWKERPRETWITSRMAHVYSLGKMLGFEEGDKLASKAIEGLLDELIETQKQRGDPNVKYSLIEKQQRFSLPFSAFILTIMGVALSSRKKRGGIGWNLAIGIALSFSYILFMRFSQMFVYTGVMPPWLAIWLPNMIFALIAGVLYKIAPK